MNLEGRELNESSLSQLQGTGCSTVLLSFFPTYAELLIFNDKDFLVAKTLLFNFTNIFFPANGIRASKFANTRILEVLQKLNTSWIRERVLPLFYRRYDSTDSSCIIKLLPYLT